VPRAGCCALADAANVKMTAKTARTRCWRI
jgi:hypothetical protein